MVQVEVGEIGKAFKSCLLNYFNQVSLLPSNLAWKFAQIERFGLPIMLLLLFTHVLDDILRPLLQLFYSLISAIFGF